jgi:hypothetical protein
MPVATDDEIRTGVDRKFQKFIVFVVGAIGHYRLAFDKSA